MSAAARTESIPDTVGAAAARPLGVLSWAALYVAGQVATFRLTTLVPWSAYPHLAEWPEIVSSQQLALAVVLVQVVLVGIGLARLAPVGALGRFVRWLGAGRAVLVAGVIGLSLAVPTQSVNRFAIEGAMAALIAVVAVGNLVLAVRSIPAAWLDAAARWVDARLTMPGAAERERRWDRGFPWALGITAFLASAAMAWFAFEGVPHIDDSVAYYFQARTFALGHIAVPAPPDLASFDIPHLIVHDGAWFGKYFPGWPALLSLGVRAGVPWLVNPLLGAGAVILAHRLVQRLLGRGLANAAAPLLAVSPWLVTSSGGMMSHPASLGCGLLALLAIERQRGRRAGAWALLAGAALGLLYLVRPPDAAALGVVAALWAWGLWGERLTLGSLAAIAATALAVAALSLPYNAALTGSPFLPPHRLWSDMSFGPGADVFGFGPGVGIPLWRDHDPLPGHGPFDVAININRNLFLLSQELFGWAAGSLWLLLVGVAAKRPWHRADRFLLAIVLAVALLHVAYWYPGGPDFGPRYWYLMIVPLAVFTIHGATALSAWLSSSTQRRFDGRHVAAAMIVASVVATAGGLPWRGAAKYHRYREIGDDLRSLSSGSEWRNALVFVDGTDRSDYQAAINFLSPDLAAGRPVLALDAGAEHRAAVLRRFADRPVWVVGRPADNSPRLVIRGGPYPPGTDPLTR